MGLGVEGPLKMEGDEGTRAGGMRRDLGKIQGDEHLLL